MRLHAHDPNHPHTIAEHCLRTLYYYARGAHGARLRGDPRRLYVGCLTALLHDIGKLDSPRSKANRQLSDPGHPALSAAYVRQNGARLGLSPGEVAWAARMILHHRDLGTLQRAAREAEEPPAVPATVTPAAAPPTPEQIRQLRADVAAAMHTRHNLDYLVALTEADVMAISAVAHRDWKVGKYLPLIAEQVARELPGR